MSNLKRLAFLFCVFAISGLLSLQAQDKPDPAKFVGAWKMIALTPDGDTVPWRLTLKQQEGKLVGVIVDDDGESPIKDLTLTGLKLHFTTPYDGETYDQDLELQGEKLVGTWSGNGNSGKTTGERAAGS
jgi:hypothetical protein